jgi:uncharacterized membrane protein
MHKGRLEAFSDGVIAIIITIMVLELKVPHDGTFAGLEPLLPIFLSYVLSFIYIGIYWNNHHHFMQVVEKINGKVLWANMHLLFWLSTIPFSTAWMGENHFSPDATTLYGVNLLMCAMAYTIVTLSLKPLHGPESKFSKAIGKDIKGKISLAAYVAGILLSQVNAGFGYAMYIGVALIWLVHDLRIERIIEKS